MENNITENTITENNITGNNIMENNITENNITENNITENTITENTITENTITENAITENTITEMPGADENGEEVTYSQVSLDFIIKETQKAKKQGTIKGALITAGIMTLCVALTIAAWIIIKAVRGGIPISALSPFSSSIIDGDLYDKAEGIYALIENLYFNEIDEEALRQGMYKGMVDALEDPYSTYYTKEEFSEMMSASDGSFEGIGAYLQQDGDTMVITVIRPISNSPAEKVGMLAGDIIKTVDGEDISEQDINLVVSKMKGPAGTTVVIGVKREGEKDLIEFTIERALVYEESVDWEMLEGEDDMGYIYVGAFEEDTANQFRTALNELKEEGAASLIIDLRDDGGGYVDVSVEMADMILPECNIVSTKDKHGITMSYDSSDTEFIRMPIVLLVNENTASASEIFTGALRDNDYATIVGEKTFGKGIVQEVIPLDDGSGVKLTISEYYTPKGECIHGVGIEPDVEIELDVDKYLEEGTDNQLEKAKEVLRGM